MLDRIKNKTNATIKKLLTLVMALAMTITCIPTMAFAAENSEQVNKNLMAPDTYKNNHVKKRKNRAIKIL